MNSKIKQEGISLPHVCFESLLVDNPLNSYWIDTGVSIDVMDLLKGFTKKRKPNQDEIDLFVGNGEKFMD